MWNKIVNSRFVGLLVVIVISIITYNKWFVTSNIFGWGDWGFLFSDTVKEWFSVPSAWVGAGLGYVDIGLSMFVPVRIFYGFLAHFMEFRYFDRIIFLFPSVIISSIGSFLLVKKITKNTIAAIVGSFVYSYNTYILMLNTGHFTLSVAFGIGIIVFLLYQKTLETQRYFWALLTGLVAFIEFSYEARAFYLTAWILLFYFVYKLLNKGNITLKMLIKDISLSIIPVIITVSLSLFWIVSLFINLSSFSGIVAGRQLYGEGHFQIQRALTTFHPFWTGSHRLVWGNPQQIFWWFWLIPFLSFAGYWFNRKNKLVIFWTAIALLGVFLTKFTSQPFTGVYLWLYQHIPGFSAFRESSKFNYFIDLGYSVLIGSLVGFVMTLKMSKLIKGTLIIGISSLFLVNAIPVFTGELGRLLISRHIPNDYLILKDFIYKQPEFFRTLYFPRYSRWGYWDSNHPSLDTTVLINSDWRSLNNYRKTGLEYSSIEEVTSIFKNNASQDLIDMSSVKYVIVPTMDLENEEMFVFYSEPRQQYIDFLDSLSYLKRIDIGTSELVIYENYQYKPHIYSYDGSEVEISRISSNQFDLKFKTKGKNVKLILSEIFNPGWKIRIGNFSWWRTLFDRSYYLSDDFHTKNEFELNQFMVPEVGIGQKATLYFSPQAWINVGSIISLSTLLLSLLALLILWKKRNE